ncbi:MAG TPA: TolC family protein [Bryobacteraceae bacterium]|jgi:outer membrane protein TolC|nr:TolC family protein [Bryobacteraceae bacterium]
MRLFQIGVIALYLIPALPAADLPTPLSALLDEATRSNPDIQATRLGWQAATQVPSQVSTPPDPQVTLQHVSVGSPRPFAGYSNSDFAYIGFGISQDLPYPGKLKLRGEAAQQDAAISREKLEAVRRSILQQVKEAYYQIAYVQQTLEVLDRNGKLLEQLEKIADARYRVGEGSQQDILKSQLERTKLLREVAHHHELMHTQQALLRKLLNRPPDSPDISTEPLVETPLVYTSEELLGKVRTENPEVAGQQETVKKQSLQVEIARKDRYPDFSVQYMWQHTAEPFRDYYMLSVSARIPIYRRRKLNPEMTQAVEELNRSRREYESQIQTAYFDVRNQYIAAETASQMLKIYREGLIPQALAAYQSGLTSYQTGGVDFDTLFSSFLDVLNFDGEYWKTLMEHETALARIEQITGVPLN